MFRLNIKYHWLQLVLSLAVLCAYANLYSDETANSMDPVYLTNQIAQLQKKHNIPGASIAVVHNGKLVWTQEFGYADLASKRLVQLDTLFQACSITKTLTSTAVLQVLDKYKISLDAPVNDYLKRWKIPNNQFTKDHPISIRMLLNHTAAISNPYPDGGYSYNATLPTLTQVFLGQPPATNPPLTVTAIPGTKYNYCNGCYAILQMFLEDVTGESYPALMQRQILGPVHMDESEFNNELFLKTPTRVALPYDPNKQRFPKAPTTSPIYATGWLWTTPTDLAKFLLAIQKSLKTPHGLLPQSQALSLVTPSNTPTRGLGFYIANKEGNEEANGRYFMHAGNNIGYLTLLIGSLDGQDGAVLMINISPEWNAQNYPQFEFIKDALKTIASSFQWK